LNAFVVSIIAYALILSATLGLTRGWLPLGRIAALLLVGCSPVLLDYSRSFNFAVVAAACVAGALYFAQRSRSFSRTAPAIGWGACLGLMLLARTMTVAFLPWLLAAAIVPVLAERKMSGVLRIAAGLGLGAGIAATWYVHNLRGVYNYLTSFGYGSKSSQYRASRSILSPHDWYLFLRETTKLYLFAAEALVLLAGWLAVSVIGLREAASKRPVRSNAGQLARELRLWIATDPIVVSCAIVGFGAPPRS
jgi:hypothetical protein